MMQVAAVQTTGQGNLISVDSTFMYSNHKGVQKPRIEKRQRKLLAKVGDVRGFLAKDEQILLVTTCVSPTSMLEQMTAGWVVFYINRAVLVVTNKRIFHIPSSMNFSYRSSIAQINYADCKDIRISGRTLKVHYQSGKKDKFLYVPRQERKKLKHYFKELVMRDTGRSDVGRAHLCPQCTKPLKPKVYKCQACGLVFKDMTTALRLSLLMPGGGYFYTRHPILGAGDFIVEAYLIVFGISLAVAGVQGEPSMYTAAGFFGVILVIEKLITIHHARRYISEYIPQNKRVKLRAPST